MSGLKDAQPAAFPFPLPDYALDDCTQSLDLLVEGAAAVLAVVTGVTADGPRIVANNTAAPAALAVGESFPKAVHDNLIQTSRFATADMRPDAAALSPSLRGRGYCIGRALKDAHGVTVGGVWLVLSNADSLTPFAERLFEHARGHIELCLNSLSSALGRERERLRKILDAIPAPIFVKDGQHRWIECNESAARMTGLPRPELLGKTDTDIFGVVDEFEVFWSEDRRVIDLGEELETEHNMLLRHGERRDFVVRKSPVQDPSGLRHLVGVIFDVTQRRHYERALQRIDGGLTVTTGVDFYTGLTQYLCHAFDVDYALIGRLSEDGTAIDTIAVHGDGEAMTPFTYDLPGTPCQQVTSHEVCVFERNVAHLFPQDHLLADMAVEGYAGAPLYASNGEPLGVIAVLSRKPMTNGQVIGPLLQLFSTRVAAEIEREQAMVELREAKETAERALDDLHLQKEVLDQHAIVAITDQAGRITYVNDTFCSVSGYDREELLGQNHRVLKSGHHSPEFFEDLWRTISNGRIWQGEIRNRAKDGSHYWLNTTIAPMFTRKGRVRGYIALRTDITARKEAELELQNAKDKAEFANQAKSEFLAHMSHELRTPLNAIIGFAEIILEGTFGEIQPPRYKEYLTDLHASARLLLDLINNVLDVSKIEAGEMTAEPEPTELAPIIRRTIRMLEQRATAKNITLQSDLPKTELIVHADLRHVRQILQNLLTNAVKYTQPGGLVTLRARGRGARMIAVEVIDNGVGIPENEIETVMQPFAQASSTRHGVQEGTGLGLPLSHRLTKMNGGDMSIESVEGEGTTVTAILPAYIEDDNAPLCAPTLGTAGPS